MVALVATAAATRWPDLADHFWIDEGISVGIASHGWTRIPAMLRLDGSPPFYYLILHFWVKLFGSSEAATHLLSLGFALACIPAAYLGVRRRFGRRAGVIAAVLFAANPYLVTYSTETRMYTLLVLLALGTTLAFLEVFAFGNRRGLAPFVLGTDLMLYTHNWAVFFVAGLVAATVPCLVLAKDRRRLATDFLAGFGVAGLLWLPWVPTLLYQATHTAAPWSLTPSAGEITGAIAAVLGDQRSLVAVILGGGAGLVAMLRSRSGEAAAVAAAVVLPVVTVIGGWLASQVNPGWTYRYFGIFLAPLLIVAAAGLSREGGRGLVALGLVLFFWIQPLASALSSPNVNGANGKGDVQPLAEAVGPMLSRGDWVIAIQMEELPVLDYYLPGGLNFANATGPQPRPEVVDWRDATARMSEATPEVGLIPLLERAQVGTRFLLVCPRMVVNDDALLWFRLMEDRCEQWREALELDPRLKRHYLSDVTTSLQTYLRLYSKEQA
ncbi:MAG TPA: glycosyltransferase family 39 protein [Actinomycetota bacterium]|nr:glycosyltransferase family 39 protein [Actinomycetota bacterium]